MTATIALAVGSQAATNELRVGLDLRDVNGATWRPAETPASGDPVAAEVAIDLAKKLSLRSFGGRVLFFGVADSYEILDAARSARSYPGALGLTHYLRAWRSADRTKGTRIELQIQAVDESIEPVWYPKDCGFGSTSRCFSDAVWEAVTSLGHSASSGASSLRPDPLVKAKFEEYPMEHHTSLARARLFRALGRRYGQESESGLLGFAEDALQQAARNRGAKANGPSPFETLERCALAFRRANLGYGFDEFNAALRYAPSDGEAEREFPELLLWKALGGVFGTPQDLCAAISSFGSALELAPGFADAWLNRGLTAEFFALPKCEGAVAPRPLDDYRRAVQLNPGNLRARAHLATALEEAGDTEGADRQFREILEVRDYPYARYQRASTLFERIQRQSGALDEAALRPILGDIDAILAGGEFYDEDARILKAKVLQAAGLWEAVEGTVIDSLRGRALAVSPSYISALESAAPGAETLPDVIARINPGPDRRGRQALADQAVVALIAAKMGQFDAAIAIADGVESHLPEASDATEKNIRLTLSLVYHRLGYTNTAKRTIESIQTSVPEP